MNGHWSPPRARQVHQTGDALESGDHATQPAAAECLTLDLDQDFCQSVSGRRILAACAGPDQHVSDLGCSWTPPQRDHFPAEVSAHCALVDLPCSLRNAPMALARAGHFLGRTQILSPLGVQGHQLLAHRDPSGHAFLFQRSAISANRPSLRWVISDGGQDRRCRPTDTGLGSPSRAVEACEPSRLRGGVLLQEALL
jgi:hypothetical protein